MNNIEKFDNMTRGMLSEDFVKWLKNETGYFVAPASTKFHGNYEGGLLEHSIAVAESLLDITAGMNLKWERPESPVIIGLFHDICKHDLYFKNTLGKWSYDSQKYSRGHGDYSVKLLEEHMVLTEEEKLCIRWHMGAFDEKVNWNGYGSSVEKYPNVLWTHTADMIASRVKGI